MYIQTANALFGNKLSFYNDEKLKVYFAIEYKIIEKEPDLNKIINSINKDENNIIKIDLNKVKIDPSKFETKPSELEKLYSFHLKKWKRICINKRKPRY